jgi:predicted dehydrogenase
VNQSNASLPPIRIGILGTARINRLAILGPARRIAGVVVAAVASRSPERAARYARRTGIPKHYGSYAAPIDDPEIDLIYNSRPNSLHAEWSIRALEAGKHVLCEKPLAANANEAAQLARVADRSGRMLIEAFHYRYHPLARRIKEIVTGGELGNLRTIETAFCIFVPGKGDIRFSYDLAGGATMDLGCYVVNFCRYLAEEEPVVTSASARLMVPQIDRWMTAELAFPKGVMARITVSLRSPFWKWRAHLRVTGDRGTMYAFNPFLPQFCNFIRVRTEGGGYFERATMSRTTYGCQLEAVASAIRSGVPLPTNATDSIANAKVLDAIYRQAGLRPRGIAE